MQTFNLSLPKTLAEKIDELIQQEGYASRSEFFRALARFYLTTQASQARPFLPFKKVPLATVTRELRNSGKYNEKFIKSVVKGLSRSTVYAKN